MSDDIVARLRTELAKERERADAHYRALECVSAERDELRAELAAAEARAERAEAALLPFAELATFGEESVDYFIRDEDVCRARAVLAQTETSCE